MNKTYFDKLSKITYNDFITDTSTYKNNIEELLNGCESVLRNVCNELNEGYSKWKMSHSEVDLIRLLQNYMDRSLGNRQIKNKDCLILMGFAMYSIRKLIGDLKNIFSSFEKEEKKDDEHNKHLYFNLIRRVSASGTRLIREFSDFADIAVDKCIQLTNPRPSWPYEFSIWIEYFFWGYLPNADGPNKFDVIPPEAYGLCLIRPFLESIIFFRTMPFELGLLSNSTVTKKDGERNVSIEPNLNSALSKYLGSKKQGDSEKRNNILRIYVDLKVIDSRDKEIIKKIYSLSSGVIHRGRIFYSCEVFVFKSYIEYLEKNLEQKIRNYGTNNFRKDLSKKLDELLSKKQSKYKEFLSWLKRFPFKLRKNNNIRK